ncbi:hypothetical protein JCGZ_05106 [Jatropha curcas]|uniref:Uncharacterized protein n=1 Tax=Jatropha curcas TaxID=180498 RepID=A0A067LR44_JATCU|nr:hypothetical protein JCGZ_05106 [Jatropha curcas]
MSQTQSYWLREDGIVEVPGPRGVDMWYAGVDNYALKSHGFRNTFYSFTRNIDINKHDGGSMDTDNASVDHDSNGGLGEEEEVHLKRLILVSRIAESHEDLQLELPGA